MLLYVGAGLSTYFGIPDMRGFIKIFDDDLGSRELYSEIRSYMADNPNLEVLMTVLSDLTKKPDQFWKTIAPYTSEFLIKSNGLIEKYVDKKDTRSEAVDLLEHIEGAIFKACIGSVENNKKNVMEIFDVLFHIIATKGVLQMKQSPDKAMAYPDSLCILTTNYDTAIEAYWQEHEVRLHDGLVEDHVGKSFRLQAEPASFVIGSEPVLFKFHGSVNLFRRRTQVYSDNVSSEEVEKLGIESIVRKYGDLTLVFPIESVGQEHVTQSPYLDMYSIFRTALKSQTRNRNIWLIIGTSLQDATLCSAMENALAVTPAGEWPEIILLSKSAQESKTSLNPRYNTLKEHLLPLNANIEPGADGFGKFDELLRQLKENNRLKS